MKKFEIIKIQSENWVILHNEFPRFTCEFENKKFNHSKIINGLKDPMGNPSEVKLLLKMEQWLLRYHKDKMI